MATSNSLRGFWEFVETDFPPTGVRKRLASRLGPGLATQLELAKLLTYVGQAETYPCPQPGGSGCPRRIVHHADGRIVAVCGSDPPECEDAEVSAKDIEVLGVSPERLCEVLGSTLRFGGKPEKAPGLHRTLRAGTFEPSPGVRQAVYFAACSSAGEYVVALDVLRSRHGAEGFALLVPTDRFIGEEAIRESGARGIVVIPLAGLFELDASGAMTTDADAAALFAGIGRTGPGAQEPAQTVFAQVFTRDGWRNLDQGAYRRLLESAAQYDVFADEHTKEVRKLVVERKKAKLKVQKGVLASHFQIVRKAVETNGRFDPVADPRTEEQLSAKQIMQRARPVFDVKCTGPSGGESWRLFKTEMVDKHSTYRFLPDAEVKFALVFLPRTVAKVQPPSG